MTRGWTAPETMEAAERAVVLAEKSGNVGYLVGSMTRRFLNSYLSGDLSTAGALHVLPSSVDFSKMMSLPSAVPASIPVA